MLAAKRRSNCRPSYVASLRHYCSAFSAALHNPPVCAVTTDHIRQWFDSRDEVPGSFDSNWRRLYVLFAFAQRNGLIKVNPVDALEKPRLDHKPPRILSIAEAEQVMLWTQAHKPCFLPPLTLMLYCGVRPQEVRRLTWADIDLDRSLLTINGHVAKTRRRRIVHIPPNAVEWLRLGGELPCLNHRRNIRRLKAVLGYWTQDVLRHTAASYMLARDGDAGRVATQLGNSVQVLMQRYVDLVPNSLDFWQLRPSKKV